MLVLSELFCLLDPLGLGEVDSRRNWKPGGRGVGCDGLERSGSVCARI